MTKARAFTIAGLVNLAMATLLAMTFLVGQPGTALGSGMFITRTPTPTRDGNGNGKCKLTCTKTASQTEVSPGDKVTFVIRMCNEGDSPCKSIVIRDDLPHELEVLSVFHSQGKREPDGNRVEVQVGNLSPGKCAEVTIVARVGGDGAPCTQFINKATIGDDVICALTFFGTCCLPECGGNVAQSGEVIPQAVVAGLLVMGAGLLAAGLALGARNRAP